MSRLPRNEYPLCPRCGGPVAGASMTSQSVDLGFGMAPRMTYYHPNALSVYCVSASCNWDHKLFELTTPVPAADGKESTPEEPTP